MPTKQDDLVLTLLLERYPSPKRFDVSSIMPDADEELMEALRYLGVRFVRRLACSFNRTGANNLRAMLSRVRGHPVGDFQLETDEYGWFMFAPRAPRAPMLVATADGLRPIVQVRPGWLGGDGSAGHATDQPSIRSPWNSARRIRAAAGLA